MLEDLGYSREEVLHRLRYQRPGSSFRSGYAYTNFGLTEGGLAAAKSAGKEWEDVSEEKLYGPLGMSSTSSRFKDFVARENRALGHVEVDGKWVHKLQRNPDAQSPAGGVSSSVDDMAKWMRLQLAGGKFEGKEIVKADALAQTHHPHMLTGFSPLDGLPGFYGLGWNVSYDEEGRLRLSHSGAFELGAATVVALVPSEALGIVVLTNAFPLGVAEGLASTFLDYALHGKPTQNWLELYKQGFAQGVQAEKSRLGNYTKPPASPALPSAKSSYLGSYRNEYFGEICIVDNMANSRSSWTEKDDLPDEALDPRTFTYQMQGELVKALPESPSQWRPKETRVGFSSTTSISTAPESLTAERTKASNPSGSAKPTRASRAPKSRPQKGQPEFTCTCKLALAPYAWFDPILEWYTPPSEFSHGTYFGLGDC